MPAGPLFKENQTKNYFKLIKYRKTPFVPVHLPAFQGHTGSPAPAPPRDGVSLRAAPPPAVAAGRVHPPAQATPRVLLRRVPDPQLRGGWRQLGGCNKGFATPTSRIPSQGCHEARQSRGAARSSSRLWLSLLRSTSSHALCLPVINPEQRLHRRTRRWAPRPCHSRERSSTASRDGEGNALDLLQPRRARRGSAVGRSANSQHPHRHRCAKLCWGSWGGGDCNCITQITAKLCKLVPILKKKIIFLIFLKRALSMLCDLQKARSLPVHAPNRRCNSYRHKL